MRAALPFLACAVALAAASQLLLRRGMAGQRKGGLVATLAHALRSRSAWAGSLGYAAAMGFWLEVLGRADIGLVYPVFTGGVTCLVMAASVALLRERLGPRRLAGAALMLAGIFVAYLE